MTNAPRHFALLDPAFVMDGLFVPTVGKARPTNAVVERKHDQRDVRCMCGEQLGAFDQSVLLALLSEMKTSGRVVESDAPEYRALALLLADTSPHEDAIAILRTSRRRILERSGYKDCDSGGAMQRLNEALNRLRKVSVEEAAAGVTRRSNLLGMPTDERERLVFVINRSLAAALFAENRQFVRVDLAERNELSSEIAKLLLVWLSSHVQYDKALGRTGDVRLDRLAIHIWGRAAVDRKLQSHRRKMVQKALDELAGSGAWHISCAGKGNRAIARIIRNGRIRSPRTTFGESPDKPMTVYAQSLEIEEAISANSSRISV